VKILAKATAAVLITLSKEVSGWSLWSSPCNEAKAPQQLRAWHVMTSTKSSQVVQLSYPLASGQRKGQEIEFSLGKDSRVLCLKHKRSSYLIGRAALL
jgi:hypothetical protein